MISHDRRHTQLDTLKTVCATIIATNEANTYSKIKLKTFHVAQLQEAENKNL